MKNYIRQVKRINTNSYKWDSVENNKDLIPLWVADMDLQAPKEIVDAVIRRAKHPAYGYVKVPEKYYTAVCAWFSDIHGWNFLKNDIVYTTGVVPAVSAVIKAVTKPGDKVMMFTPVYNCFYSSIRNNECSVVSIPLIRDENLVYQIDFENFKKQIETSGSKVLLLCNPHNPVSRVFSEDELTKIAEICKQNDIFVISDEIHCEIIMPDFKYTPFGIVADKFLLKYAVCNSPSKTFNTASLQIANIICKDKLFRKKIIRAININECCDVNPFGVEALITGYTSEGCRYYIKDLINTIYDNYQKAKQLLEKQKFAIKITPLEGTYLMWVECCGLDKKSDEIEKELLEKYNVWINSGTLYGQEGEGFVRINLACPERRLLLGIERFIAYYKESLLSQQ